MKLKTDTSRNVPRVGRALARLRDGTFLILAGVLELIAAVAALAVLILGKLGWLLVCAILGPPLWAATRLGGLLGRVSSRTVLVVAAFVVPPIVLPVAMSQAGPRPRWVDWMLLAACLASTAIVLWWAAAGRAVARPQPKPKPLDDFA
ncbi:hypothetical protein [Planctomyces sp. SH-PL62]|uniref:hypothetical protein n=1 Tax=Planctomyces sp. SH-PL62 TaxID=1636152 RepID=UPI00078DDDCB|nr:hypothetical protein [Planctomyces sp. SH-PL62]AMV37841.1 hypothetical protein VT85_10415 [Planctomyces sp. SH-PL62]